MYNKITLMGRITRDLELEATPNGASVCKFSIAVDRRFQQKGEEKKSDFFNIVAWRQQAEFVVKYFAKGRMVLIDGEVQTRPYTDKNGNKATWYEVIADRISFTGEKSGADSGSAVPNGAPPVPATGTACSADSDDDYPF